MEIDANSISAHFVTYVPFEKWAKSFCRSEATRMYELKLTVNPSHTVKTDLLTYVPADRVYVTLLQTESHWKTAQQNWSQLMRKFTTI